MGWYLMNGLNISHHSIRIFISNSTTVSFLKKKHPEEKALEKIRQDVMNQLARCADWKTFLKTTKCRCEKCGEAKRSGKATWVRVWKGAARSWKYLILKHIPSPSIIGSFFFSYKGKLGQCGYPRGVPCPGHWGHPSHPTIRRALLSIS